MIQHFLSWEKVFALPPACHSPLRLCPKRPLLTAILRQQQIEKIMNNKYNNTILYANIFIEVHWLKFLSNNQPP